MMRRTSLLLAAALLLAPLGPIIAYAAEPRLSARLVDMQAKAAKRSATVDVTVEGIVLTDPSSVAEKAAPGQGHLHYQVDDGIVIATTAPKLSFHGLTPGAHRIKVMLAGNDHAMLGPSETMSVQVP
jgi:Family of unknown function (DUF6130)